jgi:hypothetical protein
VDNVEKSVDKIINETNVCKNIKQVFAKQVFVKTSVRKNSENKK